MYEASLPGRKYTSTAVGEVSTACRRQRRVRSVAWAFVLAGILTVVLSRAACADDLRAASDPSRPEVVGTLDEATGALKAGDAERAARILDGLAQRGNSTAALLLGHLYVEGNGVPRDITQAMAWLQFARAMDWSQDRWVSRRAVQTEISMEPVVSGQELLEADRLSGRWRSDYDQRMLAKYGDAVRVYTDAPLSAVIGSGLVFRDDVVQLRLPTADNDEPLVRLGCGQARNVDCPDRPVAMTGGSCDGKIVRPDFPATARSARAVVTMPGWHGKEGVTSLLLHVGNDGRICSVVLMGSSGSSLVDRAAADAVAQWLLEPASKDGAPVESLFVFQLAVKGP